MKLSHISLLLCVLVLIGAGSLFYPKWQKDNGEAQLSWDASGYYWYLPSIFIYQDLNGQHFKDSILQKYQPLPSNDFQIAFEYKPGRYVMKYTIGRNSRSALFCNCSYPGQTPGLSC